MLSMKRAFERLAMLALLALVVLTVVGCATRPRIVTEEKFSTVEVMVPTKCVAQGGRPERVVPLRERVTREEWNRRAPGAKAEAVRAQAGRRMNYADELAAATSACP